MSLPVAPPAYHALPDHEIIQVFGSSIETGLTAEEVARRYERYGWNELQFKPGKPAWLRFLLQFHQPLLYILLVAGTVKAFLGSWINATVIWGVTLINAVIGYIQEAKAEGAIAALAKAVATETTVWREGQPLRLPSRELVPGDVVLLTSGDKVPADLRLLQVRNLQVDESALTGEAVPVPKSLAVLPVDAPLGDRRNMAYAGSFVTTGDLAVARTMAIQALVAARMVYLVSISQLGADIGQYVRGRTQTIAQVPILMVGMVSAIALQILFSQWGVMNTLFATAPLTGEQWLICLGPMLPMIPTALWVNRLDALSRPAASQP